MLCKIIITQWNADAIPNELSFDHHSVCVCECFSCERLHVINEENLWKQKCYNWKKIENLTSRDQ